MKSKLLIVADLGLMKAYQLDFTPNHPPRLEKILEKLPLAVCMRIKKNLPRDLTKVGQKELLDQFLNADAFAI